MALRTLLCLHLLLMGSISTSSWSNAGVMKTAKELSLDSIMVNIRSEASSIQYWFRDLDNNASKTISQSAFDNQGLYRQSLPEDNSIPSLPTQLLIIASTNTSNPPLFGTPAARSSPTITTQDNYNTPRTLFSLFTSFLNFTIQTLTKASPIISLLSITWLYFSGSLFFDLAHYTLHKFSKSKSRILRNIGYLHEVHHLYFNRRLKFNDRYRLLNMCYELPLELSCQLFGTWLGYLLACVTGLSGPTLLSKEILMLVLIFEAIRSSAVAFMEGRDSNHQSYETVVPKDPHSFLVGPEYHALHHVDPNSYLGSSFKIFDWFLGTSCSLKARRVTIFGSLGEFGAALKHQLLLEQGSCVEQLRRVIIEGEEGYERIVEVLRRTDILVVGEDVDVQGVVELFKRYRKAKVAQSLLLPEVWQISCARAATVSMQQIGRGHEDENEDILFRHIIYSREWLKEQPEVVAKMAIWWIRRGVRSVPATLDIWAFLEVFVVSKSIRCRQDATIFDM